MYGASGIVARTGFKFEGGRCGTSVTNAAHEKQGGVDHWHSAVRGVKENLNELGSTLHLYWPPLTWNWVLRALLRIQC